MKPVNEFFHNPYFKYHRCNMLRFRKVIHLASLFCPKNVMLSLYQNFAFSTPSFWIVFLQKEPTYLRVLTLSWRVISACLVTHSIYFIMINFSSSVDWCLWHLVRCFFVSFSSCFSLTMFFFSPRKKFMYTFIMKTCLLSF